MILAQHATDMIGLILARQRPESAHSGSAAAIWGMMQKPR
jgi:hypothetical protein